MNFTQMRSFVDETLRKQFKRDMENVVFCYPEEQENRGSEAQGEEFPLCSAEK